MKFIVALESIIFLFVVETAKNVWVGEWMELIGHGECRDIVYTYCGGFGQILSIGTIDIYINSTINQLGYEKSRGYLIIVKHNLSGLGLTCW